jgi:hypothetical protein
MLSVRCCHAFIHFLRNDIQDGLDCSDSMKRIIAFTFDTSALVELAYL